VHAELRRVEHAQAGDVVRLPRSRADDLGERREPDPEQASLLSRGRLLAPQLVVAELLERELHRLRVVAGVVDEPGRRLVRELLRLDEVVEPELGRVDAELVRRVVDEPFDQVRGLGDAERAAVGDAARGIVGVPAVRDDVRCGNVVRAGDDVEEAGTELRRLRVGEEGSLVGLERRPQAGHLPPLTAAPAHVVVAREPGGDQVLVRSPTR
jgi:hypothetical protein